MKKDELCPKISSSRGCREIRQKTFLISSVRLFANRLFDMGGYCFDNVRPEQTECTQIVRTQDTEMADVLFPDSPESCFHEYFKEYGVQKMAGFKSQYS